MASIYTRNKMLWIQFTTPLGKVIRKSLKLKDDREGRSQAKLVKIKLESELASDPLGLIVRTSGANITLEDLWRQFKNDEGRNKAPGTIDFYALSVRKTVEHIENVSIRALTKKDMFDLRDKMRATEGDQNAAIYLRHLKALLNWAVEVKQFIPRNPLKGVDYEPQARPILIFKEEEIEKVLATCSPSLRDQCTFLLLTGFRLEESCVLEWDQIDLNSKVIQHHNQKGKRWSPYPIRASLARFLEALPRTFAPKVFRYQRKGSIDHEFLKVLRNVGLVPKKGEPRNGADYSVHTLKKTYVSRLIQSKEYSMAEIHFLSHHKDINTTMKYYTWFDVDFIRGKQDAAEASLLELKAKMAAIDTTTEVVQKPSHLRLLQK